MKLTAELVADGGRASSGPDFFRSAEFLEAEGTTHSLLIFESGDETELVASAPLVVREIPGTDQLDAISPYGYPGLAISDGPLLRLDFPDDSFDTVAVTFVLLCLPDELQLPALRELARVVRPNGRVLILDYHQAGTRRAQIWAEVMSGFLRWAWAGRFDPATERYIGAAGLRVEVRRSFMGDLVTMLTLRRDPGKAL